jgi:2'-5' RNA ligase
VGGSRQLAIATNLLVADDLQSAWRQYQAWCRLFQAKPDKPIPREWLIRTESASEHRMRLFFALLPPRDLSDRLSAIMHGVYAARWQSPQQLHLTLRFVGEVSAAEAEELAAMLPRTVSGGIPPVALSGVGFFGVKGRPNALWIKAVPPNPLTRLHNKLDRLCQAAGLEPERRAYLPHVTVARLSRKAGPIDDWIARNAGFTTGPVQFERCSLMQSVPGSEGSAYLQVASVRLE